MNGSRVWRAVAGIIVSIAVGVTLGVTVNRSAEAVGPHTDLYFMSALARSANPPDWCTGVGDPAVHGDTRAIDVFGDNVDSLCAGEHTNYSAVRAWGFSTTSNHLTMRVYAAGGEVMGACDVVDLGMIDVQGGLHGEMEFLHSSNTTTPGTPLNLYASQFPGVQNTRLFGATTADDGCPWIGRHVHQGTEVDCMTVNNGFAPSDDGAVWDIDRYIHELDYAEGNALCDG